MHRNYRALFGLLAAAILQMGVVGLPLLIPGYSQVRQTVSEIGEMDSPARIPFAVLLCCVAAGVAHPAPKIAAQIAPTVAEIAHHRTLDTESVTR